MSRFSWSLVLVFSSLSTSLPAPHRNHVTSHIPQRELDPQHWTAEAELELERALNRRQNTGVARNIILFVGDGMGVSTVTASRIYHGQQAGLPGEESSLAFDHFPHVAFSKTYNVDHQIADSAATATAFLCGVKANYGTLGLDARAPRGNCRASQGRNLTCIAELARRAGKSIGFVTTSRVTHATPAPLYAHTPDRMWESDNLLPDEARQEGCQDIAAQLLGSPGVEFNVIMGGGRKFLMPKQKVDPEYSDHRGSRADNRDLISEWLEQKDAGRARYVWNKDQFDAVDPRSTDHLLGLFACSHMKFEGDRSRDQAGEPSLAEMVEKAIKILEKNEAGFFLLVEGARIDHAHHENTASRALEEVVSLNQAIVRASELVNDEDTLTIVTADHSHPLTIASYAKRGNPILGLTDYNDDFTKKGLSDVDGLPYTTLGYATGPGYRSPRRNLTNVDTQARDYVQATSVPTQIVSHDGSDVAIYAKGPMSHLFHSTHEQHYIFHVMKYAACLGNDRRHCRFNREPLRPDNVRTGVDYTSRTVNRELDPDSLNLNANNIRTNSSPSSSSRSVYLTPILLQITSLVTYLLY